LPGPAAIQPPQPNTTLISRLATVFWAIVLFAIAVYAIQHGGKGHVVETGLSIASVAYGCLLGVFLLGTLTRYATQRGAIVGMLCGFIFNLTLWLSPPNLPIPHVAFTWYVLLGALVTFAIGTLASLILPKTRAKALASLRPFRQMPKPHPLERVILSGAQRSRRTPRELAPPKPLEPLSPRPTTSPKSPISSPQPSPSTSSPEP
jgi:Na+/proline symporter